MNTEAPEPMWRQVVGETEPWRRGRVALILFGAVTLVNQGLLFAFDILNGDVQHLFSFGLVALLFWLQFYFIWIGVHWVRWLNAAYTGLVGFALLIWGWRDSSGLLVGVGVYVFAMAAYIGLAPSVYFFAQRQRERARWQENLIVAAVLLLLLTSCLAGVLGISAYRDQRVREGREFADRAFRRIFTQHDANFLVDHATPATLRNNGQLNWRVMMTRLYLSCGDVQGIAPAQGWIHCWYRWPATIISAGRMYAEGRGDHGPLLLQLDLDEAGGAWEIDGVWWRYVDQ